MNPQFLLGSRASEEEQRAGLAKLSADYHTLTKNLLSLLFDKRREQVLEGLPEAFRQRRLRERGAVEGEVATARPLDAADLDALADSFNGMAEALEARIRRDARFASEVSHELRSPLMTLTTTVGVLEARRDQFSERSRTALDLLSQDLSRFSRMVEDLLEISRFDAGAASLELTEINVANFVHASLGAAHLGDVFVEDRLGGQSVVIDGDKRRLARVMANLLGNATSHAGGPTGVFMEQEAGVVRIGVEDDGPGVAPGDRELIFDRFSRGSSAGRRGGGSGAGLGLSLVWEDIRLHDGRVWVEDRGDSGRGARFVVELPLPGDDPESVTV